MANKQTAVEWLEEKMTKCYTENDKRIVFRIAKAMEKEQMIEAYADGVARHLHEKVILSEQYYEETYGK